MKAMGRRTALVMASCISLFLFVGVAYTTSRGPAQDNVIKLPNVKLPPVTFSHATHVEKLKIECVTCHHKQPAKPEACTVCHKIEAEGKRPSAKEAFHSRCLTCHKEQAGKAGVEGKAPTRCNDCHKR